jgi:3-phenylpropionate/trans-cinnamate dioxygenase ferredoxin component
MLLPHAALAAAAISGRKRTMSDAQFVAVATLGEVLPGSPKLIERADGVEILLCRSGDRIFAIANRCSHAEEPLACGRIRNGWIACPAHGARFDLETGEAINPPAKDPIRTFPVRIMGDLVEIAV